MSAQVINDKAVTPEFEHPFVAMVKLDLKSVLIDVACHPTTHFSEKSLQIHLASRLLFRPEMSTRVQSGIGRYRQALLQRIQNEEQSKQRRSLATYHGSAYQVRPLQMEYGNNLPGSYRIDVALLDPEEIPNIIHPLSLKDANKKYLRPLIGIEFLTEKSAGSVKNTKKHLAEDAKKVSECRYGFVVNILRNSAWTRRFKKRAVNTQKRLEVFQREHESASNVFPQITWVGMVVNIALGEASFFAAGNRWQTVDLSAGTTELSRTIDDKLGPGQKREPISAGRWGPGGGCRTMVAESGPARRVVV